MVTPNVAFVLSQLSKGVCVGSNDVKPRPLYARVKRPRSFVFLSVKNATQVWNAHAERKKMETGDSHITSLDRADLVPEAARVLREEGEVDMANILDNTTDGARKVAIHRLVV